MLPILGEFIIYLTKECRFLQKKHKIAACILLEVRGGRCREIKNHWKTYLHGFIAKDHQKSELLGLKLW